MYSAPVPTPPSASPRRTGPVLCVRTPLRAPSPVPLASELAIYLRALREELSILVVSFASSSRGRELLALPGATSGAGEPLDRALERASLNASIVLGQFGVHVAAGAVRVARLASLARADSAIVERALARTRWSGLQIIDAQSGVDELDAAAVRAADRIALVVFDDESLARAADEFQRIERASSRERATRRARLLVCGVDRSARGDERGRDALARLRESIAARGLPAYRSFLARDPEPERALARDDRPRSALHAVRGSALDRQLRALAQEVAADLELESLVRRERAAAARRLALARNAIGSAPSSEGADAWRRILRARRPRRAGDAGSEAGESPRAALRAGARRGDG